MKKTVVVLWAVGVFALSVLAAGNDGLANSESKDSNIIVKKLRCEYLVGPAVIDEPRPRLSWVLESHQRGQNQKAYQVLVASSAGKLAADEGNLWDSRKVESDMSNQVVYGGKALKSRMRCFWKVRIWDADGRMSAWSEPAKWGMGLLDKNDWKAKWIGYDAEPESYFSERQSELLNLCGCGWMVLEPSKSNSEAERGSTGRRFFRGSVEVEAREAVNRGRLVLAAGNRYVVFVNSEKVGTFTAWVSMPVIDIGSLLKAGDNSIAIMAANLDGAEYPAGIAGKLILEREKAEAEVAIIDESWKVSKTGSEGWETKGFDDSGWSNISAGSRPNERKWLKIDRNRLVLPPVPYLRKTFSLKSGVKRALVYASALGIYELHINGRRIGSDYFTPGWTDYDKRIYYQCYDVTKFLRDGNNAIAALLADGWYAGYVGGGRERARYGSEPRLLVQLEVEYADGSVEKIVTDESWKASYGGLLEADLLMGEVFDARKEPAGYSDIGFVDSDWKKVAVSSDIKADFQIHPGVAVRRTAQIKPVAINEPKAGVFVVDMGQNFSGWAKLRVRGAEAGDMVVLRFAERLNPDGTIYTINLRNARATDIYICKGEEVEQWEPGFTFHGFQYVEVTGFPGRPGLDDITGVVVHSDTPRAGKFACSNQMVNKLYSNIVWGQRSNFLEIPTDCPQRDERLGWTGDAQIFIKTATYNMDVAAFFTKWFIDLEDAQTDQGAFPNVAPRKGAMGVGVSGWGDAGVICPWTIYQVYGDRHVVRRHYEAMKKWIGYLKKHSNNLLRLPKGFGDWLSIGEETPKDVIATAYFAYSTKLLSKMAKAIGEDEDVKEYANLFEEIKAAFNKAYVSDDGRVKGNTQTCYLLALRFGLLDGKVREAAAKHLVEAIRRRDWHLSTGFLGLSYLCPVLTETGNLDVAYRLLNNDTFPSWLYSVRNGATTIWERWDGWTKDKGFQDPGMNSFNHYAYGSVGMWLFGTVAGVEPGQPGYKKIMIRPRPGGGLTWAKAEYESIYGKIESSWRIEDHMFKLDVTIPVNTTATVYMPVTDVGSVTEGGAAASKAAGVNFLRYENGATVYRIGSGRYSFAGKWP